MAPPTVTGLMGPPAIIPKPDLPPVLRVSNREEDSMNLEPSQSGKSLVGMIYPPPEIRNIVDKTASFVARNGVDFENRIKANEAGNTKFKFLEPDNPYHNYYQSKIREFKEGVKVEADIAEPTLTQKFQTSLKQEFIPREPPPEPEFMADPATINAYELDLIKMTALFCARNGRHFMTQLMNREARNYQFDFLKPQHSNFQYFTKLVEQYTKVLLPPKNGVQKLDNELNDRDKILDDVKYRVAWTKHQKRLREREQAELEREKQAYASIDWHDFIVVQTVDFQPNETQNLPPPCTPKDVGARILAQARIESTKAVPVDVEMEMEVESDEEPEDAPDAPPPPPEEPEPEQPKPPEMKPPPEPPKSAALPVDPSKVRRNYDPHKKEATKVIDEKWVISPLTGERIPADKLAEHMRYNTVDSQYFQQKERERQDRSEEGVFAHGAEVGQNIGKFAERRTDIFGTGDKAIEQTQIGEKLGGPDGHDVHRDPKTIWDGISQKSAMATKNYVQHKITIAQQIADIKKITGVDVEPADAQALYNSQKTIVGRFEDGERKIVTAPTVASFANNPLIQQPSEKERDFRGDPIVHHNQLQIETKEGKAGEQLLSVPESSTAAHIMPGSKVPKQPTQGLQSGSKVVPVVVNPLQPNFQPNFVRHRVIVPGPVPGIAQPVQPPPPQMPAPEQPPPPLDDSSAAKRAFKPDDPFVPADIWLQQHNGVKEFVVNIPYLDDKPEWKCDGHPVSVSMDLAESMVTLKEKIQSMTNMPVSKQKMIVDGIFVKDSNTLAYYNIKQGSIIGLQVKERGGKKK